MFQNVIGPPATDYSNVPLGLTCRLLSPYLDRVHKYLFYSLLLIETNTWSKQPRLLFCVRYKPELLLDEG